MKNGIRNQANRPSSATTETPAHALIEVRAYELWQASGCRNGDDLNHWLRAEHELAEKARSRITRERPRKR
ncbi:MAG TPA: DUF2934 domain-containing protein [Candidatus Limnocylindria bacterium]|jgi:hypothetical protein|nr:DUF2934 domain-containing protein [Candidatus Limnocylindria bacterium]